MRISLVLLGVFFTSICLASSASADIAYHFVPNMNGQPSGCAQFVNVAPVVGPQSFEVTVSGSNAGCTPSLDPTSARAFLDKWGLGVLNPQAGSDKGVQGQVQLDGKNGGEFIRLEYPTEVRLNSLVFASVGSTDSFELMADGQQVDLGLLFPGATTIKEISASQGNWPGAIDFDKAAQPLGFAKVWDIITSNPGTGDGVLLENVCVEVPEPSTIILWLLGCSLIGLTLSRRRS